MDIGITYAVNTNYAVFIMRALGLTKRDTHTSHKGTLVTSNDCNIDSDFQQQRQPLLLQQSKQLKRNIWLPAPNKSDITKQANSGYVKFFGKITEFLLEKTSVMRKVQHWSNIHKENPTRCNNVSKFYYSIFIWSSTFFGRHTAHHQEPKTSLAASGLSYMEGFWTRIWWT